MAAPGDSSGPSRLVPPSRRVVARPESSLPPGYLPTTKTALKGYQPTHPDLQLSGALARQARQTTFSRTQLLVLAGLMGVVLVVGVAIGLWAFGTPAAASASNTPSTTTQSYFDALSRQAYSQAYDLLSPAAMQSESRTAFINRNQQFDKIGGVITAFTIASATTTDQHATVDVSVIRQGQTTLATVNLTASGGKWYVDSVVTHAAGA